MRQEIIAKQKSKQDEIVNCFVQIKFLRNRTHFLELKQKVFSQHWNTYVLKLQGFCSWDIIRLLISVLKNVEVSFVCCQSKHDQVGIWPKNTVTSIGVVPRLRSLRSNKFKNLMIPFSRNWRIRVNHGKVLPLFPVI